MGRIQEKGRDLAKIAIKTANAEADANKWMKKRDEIELDYNQRNTFLQCNLSEQERKVRSATDELNALRSQMAESKKRANRRKIEEQELEEKKQTLETSIKEFKIKSDKFSDAERVLQRRQEKVNKMRSKVAAGKKELKEREEEFKRSKEKELEKLRKRKEQLDKMEKWEKPKKRKRAGSGEKDRAQSERGHPIKIRTLKFNHHYSDGWDNNSEMSLTDSAHMASQSVITINQFPDDYELPDVPSSDGVSGKNKTNNITRGSQ